MAKLASLLVLLRFVCLLNLKFKKVEFPLFASLSYRFVFKHQLIYTKGYTYYFCILMF